MPGAPSCVGVTASRLRGKYQKSGKPSKRSVGRNGWYFAQSLWRLRGMLDRVVGGPGLMRGRRHSQKLRTGDALDFWRVVAHEPPRRLLLLSEMKAPGDALLEFRIRRQSEGQVRLEMVSRFLPQWIGRHRLLVWHAACSRLAVQRGFDANCA